jgi:type IV pilus assembly protein PilX
MNFADRMYARGEAQRDPEHWTSCATGGQGLNICTPLTKTSGQRGAVLVMALVILLIMTILGVTVMNTASLEARMAGNTQETNRAFHAAESGLEHSYQDGAGYTSLLYPGATNGPTGESITYGSARAVIVSTYASRGEKPRRSMDRTNIYSSSDFGTANFELASTGTTSLLAQSVVKQGISQITPK